MTEPYPGDGMSDATEKRTVTLAEMRRGVSLTLGQEVTLVISDLRGAAVAAPATTGNVEQAAPEEVLLNPHWNLEGYGHGSQATLSVDAPNLDGRSVKFNIERKKDGGWAPIKEQVAAVSGGHAEISIILEHPAPGAQGGFPVPVRFRAELVPGSP